MTQGTLYVVATPIGNLADLSPRARELLAEVDLIAAEDTRHTGRLLSHFGVQTAQFALHEHNEKEAVETLIGKLAAGVSIALVSDAGTPLISDPGYRLVVAAHRAGITVSPVPGPNAAIAALSAAGLPTDRFCYEGFLPARHKARCDKLETLRTEPRTLVFYVSVHSAKGVLADCVQVFGAARDAFLARELTKLHEQCIAAPLGDLHAMVDDGRIPAKGEFVLILAGDPAAADTTQRPTDPMLERLLKALATALPPGQAAAIAATATGLRKNDLYRRLLDLTNNNPGSEN